MNDKQRVSIQYSIAMTELPEEVSRLVKKVDTQISTCHNKILPSLTKMDSEERLDLKTCALLEEARETLAGAMCVLDDIDNIIQGYVRHQTQPAQTQPAIEPPHVPPTTHHVTDPLAMMGGTVAELQEKLKLFQQQGAAPHEDTTSTQTE